MDEECQICGEPTEDETCENCNDLCKLCGNAPKVGSLDYCVFCIEDAEGER